MRRKYMYVMIASGNINPIKRAQAIDSDKGLPRFLVIINTQTAAPAEII
ncbi:MAG: hypothetical protein ACYC0Q_08580 [Eubacteriales bacterium]